MFKTRKNSFKKKVAILACVTFISVSLPGIAQATTRHHSIELPFSLFSPVFSSIDLFPLVAYDVAAAYYLLDKDKKSTTTTTTPTTTPTTETPKDKKNKDPYDDSGNSTSKRKPNAKD